MPQRKLLKNILINSLQKPNKLPIFASALVCNSHTREAIKRESGVNPEQSRCCKFHIRVASNLLYATGEYPGRRLQQE